MGDPHSLLPSLGNREASEAFEALNESSIPPSETSLHLDVASSDHPSTISKPPNPLFPTYFEPEEIRPEMEVAKEKTKVHGEVVGSQAIEGRRDFHRRVRKKKSRDITRPVMASYSGQLDHPAPSTSPISPSVHPSSPMLLPASDGGGSPCIPTATTSSTRRPSDLVISLRPGN
ncbi:hypothetical protein NE237_021897 [Protea cynaroides]|uniref:Uncharacterized protein n=1 Tax=Protea cynaroides TaxID=273540 RepID=A0A9Q0H8U7_9MAGN|nr:hypothetical protein NE237_021897 [Protea cynaroides]